MITIYSLLWTIMNCCLMAFVVFIFRRNLEFLKKYGTLLLRVFIICCIIRILVPVEFPNHQFILPDSGFYAWLLKHVKFLLHPDFQKKLFIIVIILWIFGGIFHIRRFAKEIKALKNKMQNGSYEAGSHAYDILADIDADCHLPIYICPGIAVPTLAGYRHPAIYLPECVYSDQELKYIFLHEYTHWKRKDIPKQFLINMMCVLIWWNPAVYLIRKETAHLLEFNCDESLSKKFDIKEIFSYLEILRSTLAKAQTATFKTSVYTIEVISAKRKNVLPQRFNLLLYRDTESRRRLLPKCIIVLAGVIWICCSYYFILQTKYSTPEQYLWFDDVKTNQPVADIADKENAYLREQKDGTYLFYFYGETFQVPAEDVKAGLYEFYPIIEYEGRGNLLEKLLSQLKDWIN